MPKVKITFNLPEEQEGFNLALKGGDYMQSLYEYDNWLRNKIKHADDNASDEVIETYQLCRDKLYESMSANDVSIK